MTARGRGWEVLLEQRHAAYHRDRRARIWRCGAPVTLLSRVHPVKRHFRGVFSAEAPPDFSGLLASGRAVLFDAKDCERARWPLDDLRRHQARDLEACHVLGGLAFVALRLDGVGWVLPWETLGPRFWTWHDGQARRGAASLTQRDCAALGWRMREIGDWLTAHEGAA